MKRLSYIYIFVAAAPPSCQVEESPPLRLLFGRAHARPFGVGFVAGASALASSWLHRTPRDVASSLGQDAVVTAAPPAPAGHVTERHRATAVGI